MFTGRTRHHWSCEKISACRVGAVLSRLLSEVGERRKHVGQLTGRGLMVRFCDTETAKYIGFPFINSFDSLFMNPDPLREHSPPGWSRPGHRPSIADAGTSARHLASQPAQGENILAELSSSLFWLPIPSYPHLKSFCI